VGSRAGSKGEVAEWLVALITARCLG
jgi:hypothetical protein